METIPKSECRQIGTIRKTHGVHGNLIIELEYGFEETLEFTERLFLEIDGLLVPFFIAGNGIQFHSDKTAILAFDWVETEEYARRLVGCPVYVFNSEIVSETGEDEGIQFLNYLLQDAEGKDVGKVTAVDNYSGNIVLTVDAGGKEILTPFHEEILVEKDRRQKIIRLRLPDGLLD